MAVSLQKQFTGREYTPVHLMDEAESIQQLQSQRNGYHRPQVGRKALAEDIRPSIQVVESKQLPTPITNTRQCMSQILEDIAQAAPGDQEYFISKFYKEVKAARKSLKKQKASILPRGLIQSSLYFLLSCLGFLFAPDILEAVSASVSYSSEMLPLWGSLLEWMFGLSAFLFVIIIFRKCTDLLVGCHNTKDSEDC